MRYEIVDVPETGGTAIMCQGQPFPGLTLASYLTAHAESIRALAGHPGLIELDFGPAAYFASCDGRPDPVMISILPWQTPQIGCQVLADDRVGQVCARYPAKE